MVEAFRTLKTVFSAHAEVVHNRNEILLDTSGILRARGGSSDRILLGGELLMYSPRTRR